MIYIKKSVSTLGGKASGEATMREHGAEVLNSPNGNSVKKIKLY